MYKTFLVNCDMSLFVDSSRVKWANQPEIL